MNQVAPYGKIDGPHAITLFDRAPTFEWYMASLVLKHNIGKQFAFIHVDFENITMGCPNLVEKTHIKYDCAL